MEGLTLHERAAVARKNARSERRTAPRTHPELALALQRSAGNRAVTAMLARMKIDYVPDRRDPSATVKTTIDKLTDAELQDVADHRHDPYTDGQVKAAQAKLLERRRAASTPAKTKTAKPKTPKPAGPDQKDITAVQVLLKPTIDVIDKKAIAIVDEMNTHGTDDDRFDALFEDLKKLKASLFKTFNDALAGETYDQRALELVRANQTTPLTTAITRVGTILNNITTTTSRDDLIDDEPIKYPGAKTLLVIKYDEPTAESNVAMMRPGLQAVKTLCGFTDGEVHHAVNALRQGYKLSHDPAGMVERWLAKLDAMEKLWVHVKSDSAQAWLRKSLLPKGTSLYAHFKGMYGELWETHRVLVAGEFAAGTQLRMGKDKARPEAEGMKRGDQPTTTQDVDLSFHGMEGRRHYHEVKADPDTIVNKIGGNEAKGIAVIPGLAGPADPELAETPDQVLSYASARDVHLLKPPKHPARYPTGKNIVLMYVSPTTRNWLKIFTSKAGRRLIRHGFQLRLADTVFDAALLTKVQAKVDVDAPPAGTAREKWAKDHSGAPTDLYFEPKRYLATL